MNPEADSTLIALFAEPTQDLRDDERALRALLDELERTDRRRRLILTAAGILGAVLSAGVIALTGAASWSVRMLAEMASVGQAARDWMTPLRMTMPDGTLALGLGLLALAAAAWATFRSRAGA